ncbi:MAG: YbgA family protein, partial [Desulfobacterales bacterium]|nr:YbgA family protein [Desulfobacterales bacterium]
RSPVLIDGRKDKWPLKYIDLPHSQFALLKKKYEVKPNGRIFLPKTTQELWANHKYSVLARDPEKYSEIGKKVSGLRKRDGFDETCFKLIELLRQRPIKGRIRNALTHMWGHVSKYTDKDKGFINSMNEKELLREIQHFTIKHQEPYLVGSTALCDLGTWL